MKCIYFDDLRIASGNGNRIRIFDFNFFDKSLIPKQEVPSSQEGRRKSSVAAGTIVMDLNAGSSEVKDGTNSGKVSPHPGEVYSNRASRQSQKSNNRAGSTDVRKTPQKPEGEEWYYIVIMIENVISFVIVNFILSGFFFQIINNIFCGLCSFVFFYQIYTSIWWSYLIVVTAMPCAQYASSSDI